MRVIDFSIRNNILAPENRNVRIVPAPERETFG